jgi:hypothetical protein
MKKNIVPIWAVFWRLTIIWEWYWIRDKTSKRIRTSIIVKCECWTEKEIVKNTVLSWLIKSCWCLQKEFASGLWKITWPIYISSCAWWLKWKYWKNNPNRKWGWIFIRSVRNSNEYIKWRTSCFIRDNYTCQITWIKWDIVVHHLKSIAKILNWYNIENFRECSEAFDINNWITISRKLHNLFHKEYWKKNFTEEDFLKFKQKYINVK